MYWLNEYSRLFLQHGYLSPGETPEERLKVISDTAESILGISGFSEKFYDYLGRGFYSLSSPIWANFGKPRACPISCFGSYVEDSVAGILETATEVGMMTKVGGGTSAYFGDVRCAGSKISTGGLSEGVVPFLRIYETVSSVCKQSEVRRGSFAAYLPIDHGDITEFLKIRQPKNPIQHIFTGVCVPDSWMQSMIDGDQEKREVWASVLKSRAETGVPYIFFTDNVNKQKPEVYKDVEIKASNLCSEICLPSSQDESFVCCLSSLNLLNWDEIKKTDAVETLVYFLDAVIEEFIEKAKRIPFLQKARKFAERHRALGVGVLGWHSYLQSKMLPFDSIAAIQLNTEIFEEIHSRAFSASEKLAKIKYEPEAASGSGRRNTTLLAVAPTTSSSFILGQVSQSVEPFRSNYYVRDLAKTLYSFRNPYLQKVLENYGKNIEPVWDSIRRTDGSVQHLEFLSDLEKSVFKTFGEISQINIVLQASMRQKFIDQSQSINLMIDPRVPIKDVNSLIIEAWKLGVKTLYYQHSYNASQQFFRELMSCTVCHA